MMLISNKKLEEIDRNARAYGWEVGRGNVLTAPMGSITSSPDNPFRNPNWREAPDIEV